MSSVIIHASNTETLDDYQSELLKVEADHLPKIQSWIDKRKFRISPNEKTLELTVGDLFKYSLDRQEKSDMEKIRE